MTQASSRPAKNKAEAARSRPKPQRRRTRSAAPERTPRADPLWYKDAIIYELHVRAFADSNGDGIGDFQGLSTRLDYLRDLGATAIWLLPFYPSPLRDDGYDIADYNGVNPNYGNLRDVKRFIEEAHKRDLRVITELVINHTSDQHAWFQRARKAPAGSPDRDFYVWSDTTEKYPGVRIIFSDTERSNWTWDERAEAYYWHRFFSHQPDLNFDNPAVQEAVFEVMGKWFDLGVDAMRLDAVPYLFEREGTNCENLPETHEFLKKLRSHLDTRYPDKMLLAEANQWPEDAIAYFGDGDECHMNFHFPIMPRLFMSLRMEDRFPLIDILEQTPSIPDACQWAIFLRNHDELTLEMVTDEERDYMYRVYASDRQARINFGIRRRLAPLLDNDRKKIELLNGLLFSLPGTPVLYYGDELGMGDNIYLGDRDAVRTPMQWSGDRNAGFSRSNPQQLFLPVIIDPEYHYETLNVESQEENRSSLLWWMRRIIALRKRWNVFGHGQIEFLHPENTKVLAFLRSFGDQQILVVANLSRFVQAVELDLSRYKGYTPVEMFGRTEFPNVGELPYLLTIGPHNFYWFSLEQKDAASEEEGEARWTPHVLEIAHDPAGWLRSDDGAAQLAEILAVDLPHRRWFGSKARRIHDAQIIAIDPIRTAAPAGQLTAVLVLLELEYADGERELFALPLAIGTGERAVGFLGTNSPAVVAELVRTRGATDAHWTIYEGQHDPDLARGLLDQIRKAGGDEGAFGLRGSVARGAQKKLRSAGASDVKVIRAEQSNTSVVFDEAAILKIFRRIEAGENPELEISRHLAQAKFPYTPRYLGALEYDRPRSEPLSLCVLQEYVVNEGDAWSYALDQALRFLERAPELSDATVSACSVPGSAAHLIAAARNGLPKAAIEAAGHFALNAELLGTRTAEMHLALATPAENDAFQPERFTKLYQRSLYQAMRNATRQTLSMANRRARSLGPEVSAEIARISAQEKTIVARLERVARAPIDSVRIRCHGDYHLGQVLWTGKDFVIIDFEGEPARSLGERRLKRSAVSDLAGMLRSFQYAAFQAMMKIRERGQLGAEVDTTRGTQWARCWEGWTSTSFLKGYFEAIRSSTLNIIPSDEDALVILLDAWLLEKAMYEVRYELNNRPGWVQVPVRGVLELLGTE